MKHTYREGFLNFCQICNTKNIIPVLDLGFQPLADDLLIEKDKNLTIELADLDHKILLINKNDPDYLDMLYRQKFNYITDDEIIIKLK